MVRCRANETERICEIMEESFYEQSIQGSPAHSQRQSFYLWRHCKIPRHRIIVTHGGLGAKWQSSPGYSRSGTTRGKPERASCSGRHHFPTPTLMEDLLISEGIKVTDDRVQDFEKLFWNPGKEESGIRSHESWLAA